MEGFRTWMERAIRVEAEIDWSVHTVDYVLFKRRLRVFAERRSRLRELIRASPDERLSQDVVISILGPTAYQSPALAFMGLKAQDEALLLKGSQRGMPRDDDHNDHDTDNDSASGCHDLFQHPTNTNTSSFSHGQNSASNINKNSKEKSSPDMGDPTSDYIPFADSSGSSTSPTRWDRELAAHPVLHHASQQTTAAVAAIQKQQKAPPPNPRPFTDPTPVDPNQDLMQTDLSSNESFHTIPIQPLPPKSKKRLKKRSIWRGVSNAERNELVLFLTWEMDKVSMFYLARWHRLSQLIVAEGATAALGEEILELIAFCIINVITIRQILIRYDAFARTFEGTPLLNYYMKRVSRRQTSFRKVLFHEELNALADSYAHEMQREPEIWDNFEKQRKRFQDILDKTQRAEAIASTGQEWFTDSFVHTLRHYFLLGGVEDALGLQPEFLTLRGQSLTTEMAKLAEWRQRQSSSQQEPTEVDETVDKLTKREILQLALTLISGFLYCMNYYIVEPSSTMYVNALGAHDAMSGTLIGMTPLAAFASAVPYSIWTNHSFRKPIIFSCFFLILGNALYALAYNFRSIEMALLGRFCTGLGAPKVIIRRYMADTTPVSLRTSVNAGFGMVVAVGSALGPATAIWLNSLHMHYDVPLLGTVIVNGLTGPGFFMCILWMCFTIIVLVTFYEPHRQGLAEQKRMEAAQGSAIVIMPLEGEQPGHLKSGKDLGADHGPHDEQDLQTIFSGESRAYGDDLLGSHGAPGSNQKSWFKATKDFFELITLPVRICLGLLFAKVFTIEILVSATSALTKNRYHWQVHQVGTLGCINGLMVIPISMLVGRLAMSYQDRQLMSGLVSIGCFGMFSLIDLTDLVTTPTHTYNKGHILAVMPQRYVLGYFLSYASIQCFEGIIGSALSKVIPTALASGTLNSGLLATLVDTFGRACGDMFISLAGFIKLRQLMNLLFIPGFAIMMTCLVVIRKFYDILAV